MLQIARILESLGELSKTIDHKHSVTHRRNYMDVFLEMETGKSAIFNYQNNSSKKEKNTSSKTLVL